MGWIERARGEARAKVEAQREAQLAAEKKRKAFEAEEVTEEKAAAFLAKYLFVMDTIVQDLVTHGFAVIDHGNSYSYVHHESAGSYTLWGIISNGKPDVEQLADGNLLLSNLDQYVVFGREWEVVHPDGTSLITIKFRPHINEETHYGGVSISACFSDLDPANPESVEKVVAELQQAIGRSISEHEEKKFRSLNETMDDIE